MKKKYILFSLLIFSALCASCDISSHNVTNEEGPILYDPYFDDIAADYVKNVEWNRTITLNGIESSTNLFHPSSVSGIMESIYVFTPKEDLTTSVSIDFYVPVLHTLKDTEYKNEIIIQQDEEEKTPVQLIHHPYFLEEEYSYIPSYSTFIDLPSTQELWLDNAEISCFTIKNEINKSVSVEFSLENFSLENGFFWMEKGDINFKKGFSQPYLSINMKKKEDVRFYLLGDVTLTSLSTKENYTLQKEKKTYIDLLSEKASTFEVEVKAIKEAVYDAIIYRKADNYAIHDEMIQQYISRRHYSTLFYSFSLNPNQKTTLKVLRKIYSYPSNFTRKKSIEFTWEGFRTEPFTDIINSSYLKTSVLLQGDVKEKYEINEDEMLFSVEEKEEGQYKINNIRMLILSKKGSKSYNTNLVINLIFLFAFLFIALIVILIIFKHNKMEKVGGTANEK